MNSYNSRSTGRPFAILGAAAAILFAQTVPTAQAADPVLQCMNFSQVVSTNQQVTFSATGGNGTYAWSAPTGSPANGSGSSFTTQFPSTGLQVLTVTSNGQNATCGIQVNGTGTTNLTNTYTTFGTTQPYAVRYSLNVSNETKGISTTSGQITANKEDFITYTLTAANTGNNPTNNITLSNDLSQILPFADMVDNGGGTLSGNTLNFSNVTVPANGSVSKSFKVRVKYFLANDLAYKMTNTFGNSVTVLINASQVKGAFVAPKTGADTMSLAFAGTLTALFAAWRNRKRLSGILNA